MPAKPPKSRRASSSARKVGRGLGPTLAKAVAGFGLVSLLLVLPLRWINPPVTSFMVQHWVAAWQEGRKRPYLYHEWVDWSGIAPVLPLAVVAAEDQRFPSHWGFDFTEIGNAIDDYDRTGHLRGASTISQQVAKNLFLWSGRSLIRKGLEAWFTALIELTCSKRRILEIYLNVAQFGPDTFGVGSASWRYFYRPPVVLDARQAALMAAVLPDPDRYRLDAPSRYVRRRAAWILLQMHRLGPRYLQGL
jgi:monofunctional biosynthetic peptidoglycan transglycosylase